MLTARKFVSIGEPITDAEDGLINYNPIKQIGLDRVRLDPALNKFVGTNSTVAVIDTGLDLDNPIFGQDADKNGIADKIKFAWDFTTQTNKANDVNGHGTQVASLIASKLPLSIIPAAGIIPLKVIGDQGQRGFYYIEKALQWVVANSAKYNIKAVNLSLGDGLTHTDDLSRYNLGDEFKALNNKRITVIASTGNRYYQWQREGVSYPGSDKNVIGVGALDTSDGLRSIYNSGAITEKSKVGTIAAFSQRDGDQGKIFAPGAPLITSSLDNKPEIKRGTSFSSAIVTGAAVFAQEVANYYLKRSLSTSELEQLLYDTGTKITDNDDEKTNVKPSGGRYSAIDLYALGKKIQSMGDNVTSSYFKVSNALTINEGSPGQVKELAFKISVPNNKSWQRFDYQFYYPPSYTNVDGDRFTGIQSLWLKPGQQEAQIKLSVWGDNVYEPDQTLKLTVNPRDPLLGKDRLAVGVIKNDDLMPQIKVFKTWVKESQGIAKVAIMADKASDIPVVVRFRGISQSAISKKDFLPVDQTLTFSRSSSRYRTLNVGIVSDGIKEGVEKFAIAPTLISGQASLVGSDVTIF